MAEEKVSIIIRAKDLATSQLSKMEKLLKRIKVSASGLRTAFLTVSAALAGFAIGLKKAFDVGSDVLEQQSRFNTVFGESAKEVEAFVKVYARMAGLTERAGKTQIATTGAIVQGLGFATEQSAAFSKAIFRLAGDLASFNNIPTEDTLLAINTALTGERENLKRLGIVLREVDVQQRAMVLTGKANAKELTNQDKALASLQLITERAGVAVNDLARTQDSAANRGKQLAARIGDIRDRVATDLVPVLTDLLPLFDQIAGKLEGMARKAAAFVTTMLDMVGLSDPVARAEIGSFEQLTPDQMPGRAQRLRREIASLRARAGGGEAFEAGLRGGDTRSRSQLEKEANSLQIALDVLETRMERLKDTAATTSQEVDNVVRSLSGGAGPGPVTVGVSRGVAGQGLAGVAGTSLRFDTQFRRQAGGLSGFQGFERDIPPVEEAAEEFNNAGLVAVDSFNNMAQTIITQSGNIERVAISSFANILSSLQGVSPLGGAIIGAVGGIFGSLFGSRDKPQPVEIRDVTESAASKMRGDGQPQTIRVQVLGSDGTVIREVVDTIRRFERESGQTVLGGSSI